MKKFGKVLICLGLTCSIAFSGCGLVQRNTQRYINRTVATAGDITISKQELLTAYNTTGYQYTRSFGYTAEKAVKTTLDSLIDDKIMLEVAKSRIKQESDGTTSYYYGETGKATIFNKNVWNNELWRKTFDGVNDQIKEIEDEIKKNKGIEVEDAKEEETTSADDSEKLMPEEKYEKKVTYSSDAGWEKVHAELEKAEDDRLTVADFVQNETGDTEISKQALKRYAKKAERAYRDRNLTLADLKAETAQLFDSIYNDLGLTRSQKLAFIYELERVYTAYENDKYLIELENAYKEYEIDFDDLNEKIVKYYKQLVTSDYEKYEATSEEDSYNAFVSAMQSNSSEVYYHKDYGTNEKGDKKAFVLVSHVLVKLTSEQVAELEELEKQKESGYIMPEEYDTSRQNVLDRTRVYEIDEDGEKVGEPKTLEEVQQEIQTELDKYSTIEEKAIAFNKFVYKYGEDPGARNTTKYYAVSLDTNITGNWVKAFTDEARRLASVEGFENGGNIGMTDFVTQSNYSGYHIIFNVGMARDYEIENGRIKDKLSINQIKNLDGSYAKVLFERKLLLGAGDMQDFVTGNTSAETMYDYIFDKIFESVSNKAYTDYKNSILTNAKKVGGEYQVTYYISAYEDLYK